MSGSKEKFINLFWWSEIKFIHRKKENYGDLLSKYLVEKITGLNVKWVHPKKQPWYKLNKSHYLVIGSIIHHSTSKSVIWGSGIIDQEQKIADADFKAVRGPETRKYLLKHGYHCPKIYGDPALLLPKYFMPLIKKDYKMGIIPHYHDYNLADKIFGNQKDILVIDLMTMDVEEVTKKIISCEKTISSSLHGLIVSHAYNIPSIWAEFSDKIFGNGIKYKDYLESLEIPVYNPPFINKTQTFEELEFLMKEFPTLPGKKLKELQEGLLKSCPFI